MKQIHDNKHLSLDERKIIQTGIENRSTKKAIADTIGKDPTTIAKEIRKHRELHPRNMYNYETLCIHIKECKKCYKKCERYEEKQCKLRDKSPGACNKCPKISSCHIDHYFYYANKANDEYLKKLVDSREGINLTITEKKELGNILKPLLDQGQSIYQIKSTHEEIKQCDKTLYNYIESGVFKDEGIDNFSLKEQVQRKQFKKKYKKRKSSSNYINHTYKDYIKFKEDNSGVKTTEMDTVLNSLSGPYIQTFYFEDTNLMIGFLCKNKTSESMSNTLDILQDKLSVEEFAKLFGLLLTDRGVEFEQVDLFIANKNTGEVRLNIFYCDPYQSSQKPHIENNHNYLRDIITNEMDLSILTQQDLDLAFSHINSTPRKSLNDKSPYEMFEFLYGSDLLEKLNIKQIKRDEVILKPYLILNNHKNK